MAVSLCTWTRGEHASRTVAVAMRALDDPVLRHRLQSDHRLFEIFLSYLDESFAESGSPDVWPLAVIELVVDAVEVAEPVFDVNQLCLPLDVVA
jgi:hypothetical protein